MKLSFDHETRTARVVLGAGRRAEVPAEVARLGWSRPLVLSTPGQVRLGESIRDMLGGGAKLFDGAVMHVPIEVARRGVEVAREHRADGCVAVGGGSTIGLAKAIAAETGLPSIAIPTTYAGSEMTPLYGITADGEKRGMRDWIVAPQTIIYDPELTVDLPLKITVASGLNAIAHAVEALYAPNGSPLHDVTAKAGISSVASALKALATDPRNLDLRGRAQVGTWMCGTVLGQLQMGLHHKVCHVLGGTFDLPHAETHAVILPHAIRYNYYHAPGAVIALSDAFGGDLFGKLHELYHSLDAPRSLQAIGMPEDGLDKAADLVCAQPYPNPRPFERDAIRQLLADAFAGRFPDTPRKGRH